VCERATLDRRDWAFSGGGKGEGIWNQIPTLGTNIALRPSRQILVFQWQVRADEGVECCGQK
jgi:hypothetical protein